MDGRVAATERTGAPVPRRPRARRLLAGCASGTAVGVAVTALALLVTGCSPADDVRAAGEPTTTAAPADGTDGRPTTTVWSSDDADLGVTLTPEPTLRAVTVDVEDAQAPVAPGSRQCVHVRLGAADGQGPALAQASVCNLDAEGNAFPGVERRPDGSVVVPLALSGGAEIGPACSAVPAPTGTPTSTAAAQSTFRFELPADLPAGDHLVSVTATSGVGDGCAGTDGAADPWEGTATASVVMTTT